MALLTAMVLCLVGCQEEEVKEAAAPISDADAFVAERYGDDESKSSDEKDNGEDETELVADNDETQDETKDNIILDDELDYDYDFSNGGNNVNTSGYEYYDNVLYQIGDYIYVGEEDEVRMYLNSECTEYVGVQLFPVGYYIETMKDEAYAEIIEKSEAEWGELILAGTYKNSNNHVFQLYQCEEEEGVYGWLYICIDNDTAVAVSGFTINGMLSDEFMDLLNSVIIQ